jgi:hypothetical protein
MTDMHPMDGVLYSGHFMRRDLLCIGKMCEGGTFYLLLKYHGNLDLRDPVLRLESTKKFFIVIGGYLRAPPVIHWKITSFGYSNTPKWSKSGCGYTELVFDTGVSRNT